MNTALDAQDTPTNAYLALLHAVIDRAGADTLSRLRDRAADPAVLVQVASAAALLSAHPDYAARPAVAAVLEALGTPAAQAALADALEGIDLPDLRGEDPDLQPETLRNLVELGALHGRAGSAFDAALERHLDDLDAHILGHLDAFAALGPAAELFQNVAPFDETHPVGLLLTTFIEAERAPLFALSPTEAVALMHRALPPIEDTGSVFVGWFNAVRALLKAAGRELSSLKDISLPTAAVAYASTLDAADVQRVMLEADDRSEVNLVFAGGAVLLEWQGFSEAPHRVELEALSAPEPEMTTTHDGERRVRWRLQTHPGPDGTRVTLRFPSGQARTITFPPIRPAIGAAIGEEGTSDD